METLTKVIAGGAGAAAKAKPQDETQRVTRKSNASRFSGLEDPLAFILGELIGLIKNVAERDDSKEALVELTKKGDKALRSQNDLLTAYADQQKELKSLRKDTGEALKAMKSEIEELRLGAARQDAKFKGVEKDTVQERAGLSRKLVDMTKQIGDVKDKVTSQKGGGADMRKHLIRAERRERETNVIVRGVAYEGHDETQEQLDELVRKLLDSMPFPSKPKLRFAQRLVNKKKPRPASGTAPPVIISFDGMDYKKALFAGLPQWGKHNTEFKFSHDVPPSLKTEHDALEKRAYELRQAEPGTKTRVVIKDVTAVLLAKKPGEARFEPIAANGAEAPAT